MDLKSDCRVKEDDILTESLQGITPSKRSANSLRRARRKEKKIKLKKDNFKPKKNIEPKAEAHNTEVEQVVEDSLKNGKDTSLLVTIVPSSYPVSKFDNRDVKIIHVRILKFIDKLNLKEEEMDRCAFNSPQYEEVGLVEGACVVHCSSKESKTWLERKINSGLKLDNGLSCRLVNPNKFIFVKAIGFFEGEFETDDKLLLNIMKENTLLDISNWTILNVQIEKFGFFVAFKIPLADLDTLEESDNSVSYYGKVVEIYLVYCKRNRSSSAEESSDPKNQEGEMPDKACEEIIERKEATLSE